MHGEIQIRPPFTASDHYPSPNSLPILPIKPMKQMNPTTCTNTRRKFLKNASALGLSAMLAPRYLAGQNHNRISPTGRLQIALVGVGGRGRQALLSLIDEDIVACCDVLDLENLTGEPRNQHGQLGKLFSENLASLNRKGTRWFEDYRVMFETMGDKIDAVVITVPDHMHFPIAMSAVNLKKHVYCEKPLVHTVEEARLLTEAAIASGVVTQMGNQGHSNEGTRLVREWIQAGVIGKVREVHSWTNRPGWPQGVEPPNHATSAPPVPAGLRWDLWQGVATSRSYDPAYVPFLWRAFFDYGSGAFGDMACHIMDSPYWALDLTYPDWVEATSTALTQISYPKASIVTFHFPSRGGMPDLIYKWYDGGLRPPLPRSIPRSEDPGFSSGSYIIGEHATLITDTYSGSVRVSPKEKWATLRQSLPPKSIRRVTTDHHQEWVNAIREQRTASTDFSYAGPFTEMTQLGNVALRARTRLHYDHSRMAFTNSPEHNSLLRKPYPKGWIIGGSSKLI